MTPKTTKLIARLAALDAASLLLLALDLPLQVILLLRTLQGALNVGALSVLLGAAPHGELSKRGSRYGMLGTAMMLGVASGAPLGTLCLRGGPTLPLLAGAFLELCVCLGVRHLALEATDQAPSRSSVRGLPWLAMAWVFAERFAVGTFVVTCSFHARECLGAT